MKARLKVWVAAVVGAAGLTTSYEQTAFGQAPVYRKVIGTGDRVPGTPADVTYSSFNRLSVGNDGQFFIQAQLSGTSVTNENGLAYIGGNSSSPQLIARNGDQAIGLPAGVTYTSLYGFAQFMAPDGGYSFGAGLAGPGIDTTNNTALYLGNGGTTAIAVRKGEAAPGAGAGVSFLSFTGASIGGGKIALNATLAGTGVTDFNNSAVYVGTAGNLALRGRTGSSAAGLPANVVLDSIEPVRRDVGGVTNFFTTLRGGGVSGFAARAVYAADHTTQTLLLRGGETAPLVPGATIATVSEVDSFRGSNGHILLRANLTGTGITSANDGILYAGPIGSPFVVLRDGDLAPGVGSGVRYASDLPTGQINGTGAMAFVTKLTGSGINSTNDTAIYAGPYGTYDLVIREGQNVPGLAASARFDDLSLAGMLYKDSGQLAFWAGITGTGVSFDQGLFVYDADSGLQMVARAGQQLDLGGGDLRTISNLNPVNFGLSNEGQLLFSTSFTDGSTAVVSVQVPEPALMSLAGAPAVLLLRRPRRPARCR